MLSTILSTILLQADPELEAIGKAGYAFGELLGKLIGVAIIIYLIYKIKKWFTD